MSSTGIQGATGAELVRLLGGWLAGTGITLLELRTAEETLRLARSGDHVPAAATPLPPTGPSPAITVPSPGPGVFLDRHPLRTEPLAAPGQAVRAGEVVGLVQVGALLVHVTAPADGTVAEVAATPGCTVGYGTTLLHLHRSMRP